MDLSAASPLKAFLAKLQARSNLGAAECRAILELPVRPEQIDANRDFVGLGERVDHASLVVAGLIGRFGQTREGNRQIIAVHVPGDMANLHSLVAPNANCALQALTVTTILRVPHEALRDAARRFPAIAEAFWRECVVEAAVLAEWIVNVGRRDARSRLCHLLCEIACRTTGRNQKQAFTISFPATQAQIADMTGLTSVHVNRTLQSLKYEGIVQVQSKQVQIHNWAQMARIGDFDPDYLCLGQPGAEGRRDAA